MNLADRSSTLRRPTLAILSTWQEVCGIAHYTYFLKRALDPYFDVTVVPTPRQVFMPYRDPSEIRAGDEHARQIARELAKYDYVNIQFEPGILGRSMPKVVSRFKMIFSESKNVSVTFHAIGRSDRQTLREKAALLARGKIFTVMRQTLGNRIRSSAWEELFKFLGKKSKDGRVTAITHTLRDAHYLKLHLPKGIQIFTTPLIFIDPAFRKAMPALIEQSALHRIAPTPEPDTRYIGCFGFFASYKGFETALEALRLLPDNYELLMFSSLHESTLAPEQRYDPYLAALLRTVQARKQNVPKPGGRPLRERVHFLGAVNDDDIVLGMKLCDAVVFPYINSSHTASGPVGIALDLNCKVLASRNVQFIELQKLRGEIFELCDIGNALEYAQKIPRVTSNRSEKIIGGLRIIEYPELTQKYTSKTTASIYQEAIIEVATIKKRGAHALDIKQALSS